VIPKIVDQLTWAIVELKTPKPNLDQIVSTLEDALQEAIRQEALKMQADSPLLRLAKVMGE
jgi:hypothetical protein